MNFPLFSNQRDLCQYKQHIFHIYISAFFLEYLCTLSLLWTYKLLKGDTGSYLCIPYNYGYNIDGQ